MQDLVPFVQFKKRENCSFNISNTPPWVFFTLFKLYKWYQIVQSIANKNLKSDKNFQNFGNKPSKNFSFIYFNESPLKMMKQCFLFHVKSSFCSWDIYIFVLTWLCRKMACKKVMVNFKIYDITDWTTNNYNTHIVQYL